MSDNFTKDFPSRMSDGRVFTDYRSNCITNSAIGKSMTSWEYRYYLQNNSASIVESDKNSRDLMLSYSGPNAPEIPVKNIQNCNKGFCTIEQADEMGIGLGKFTNDTP